MAKYQLDMEYKEVITSKKPPVAKDKWPMKTGTFNLEAVKMGRMGPASDDKKKGGGIDFNEKFFNRHDEYGNVIEAAKDGNAPDQEGIKSAESIFKKHDDMQEMWPKNKRSASFDPFAPGSSNS